MFQDKVNDKALIFISEWKKHNVKQQKSYVAIIAVSILLAFALCIGFFVWFQTENHNRIVEQNMKYLQDSATQETKQLETKLDSAVKLIENFANQYSILSKQNEDASPIETIKSITDKSLFDRIGFVTLTGKDITLEGTTNIYDRGYFKKAIGGNSGYEFIEKSRVTGKSSMVFYSPVESNEKIVGVMLGFYETERLDDLFSYELFNYCPNSYLINGKGLVVANSKDEKNLGNIFDKLSKKQFSGDVDYSKIEQEIKGPNRTSITFSYSDNNSTSIGVISKFKNGTWMVLSILPEDITENMISNATRTGIMIMIMIIITFLMLILLIFIMLRRNNKRLHDGMRITTDNLKEAIEVDQKQSFIIMSLGKAYLSVYYISLLSGEYERIKELDSDVLKIPSKDKWETGYNRYLDFIVDESYYDDMNVFLDIEKCRQLLEAGETVEVEYQCKDKCWRRAVMVVAEHDKDNNVTSMIFAVKKIDFEKKKELEAKLALQDAYKAAQLASEAKTTFLSSMSHDIRTPMNAIIGMTAIAEANIDNKERILDCLNKITTSSKHLLGLINEVLDMSKIESGKVDLNEEEFSLSHIIDELVSINQPLIKEKGHTLIVKMCNLVHENVIGDSTRLQQVFNNLLTNAIKYTPNDGKIEININEKPINKENAGWYEVVFKDNGIGMSEEFQKSMFEPFSRAKDERIKHTQGTGLGMPIARNIIRMMNGDITIKSEINKGSAFTVSFLLKLQREQEIDYTQFSELPILVVDDDEDACESTCIILDSLSMNSEWVTSGREAVEKAIDRHNRNDDYYAVILDWNIPDMNGIETAKRIRSEVGDKVSIVVLTAYDWTEIEQVARDVGVNAFLSKPLFKSKMIDVFSKLTKTGDKDCKAHTTADEIKAHSFYGKKILLAEDNELNREIAVEILSMMELKVEIAEDGKQCFEKFIHSAPDYFDMILMDIQMPFMNGYEASEAIRKSTHKNAKTIPIVAMSANAFSTDVRKAFDSGMNGHMSKPIDLDVIIKTLEEHLSANGGR